MSTVIYILKYCVITVTENQKVSIYYDLKIKINVFCDYTEEAPDFRATLRDVSGREGENVELECLLSKPNIPVRWMKNRKPLTPSDRIKIVCDRYRHLLRIMETIPEDEGEYTIVLPNDKESSAILTIYGKCRVYPVEITFLSQYYNCIVYLSTRNIFILIIYDSDESIVLFSLFRIYITKSQHFDMVLHRCCTYTCSDLMFYKADFTSVWI